MTVMPKTLTTVATIAAGALLAAAPAASTSHTAVAQDSGSTSHVSAFTPGSHDDSRNAMLRSKVAAAVKATGTSTTSLAAPTTVYFDASSAPSYAALVREGAQVWNSSVSNVKLVEDPSRATLEYREGNDPSGSYAYTDGHGSGYIFFDHSQMSQYSKLRVVTHETGHAFGLPDNYSGPCSELMSGGGPGPSCTNVQPNATERSQVDSLWANGFTAGAPKTKVAHVNR